MIKRIGLVNYLVGIKMTKTKKNQRKDQKNLMSNGDEIMMLPIQLYMV